MLKLLLPLSVVVLVASVIVVVSCGSPSAIEPDASNNEKSLATTLFLEGNYKDALPQLLQKEKNYVEGDDLTKLQNRIALCYLNLAEYKQAISYYEKTGNTASLMGVYMIMGDFQHVLSIRNEIAEEVTDPNEKNKHLFWIARTYESMNDLDKASELYENLLSKKLNPPLKRLVNLRNNAIKEHRHLNIPESKYLTTVFAVDENYAWTAPYRYDKKTGISASILEYFKNNEKYGVAEIAKENDNLWITTEDGLTMVNLKTQNQNYFEGLEYIAKTDEVVWLHNKKNEIITYDVKTDSIHNYGPDMVNELGNLPREPFSVAKYGSTFYFGTRKGVLLFNEMTQSWRLWDSQNSKLLDDFAKCAKLHNGELWFSGLKGISIYNPENDTWRSLTSIADTELKDILDITFDGDSIVWFASTSQGVLEYNITTETITQFSRQGEVLPSDKFYTIIVDPYDDNLVWASSPQGICVYDKNKGTWSFQ